jgi:hypothetical protein
MSGARKPNASHKAIMNVCEFAVSAPPDFLAFAMTSFTLSWSTMPDSIITLRNSHSPRAAIRNSHAKSDCTTGRSSIIFLRKRSKPNNLANLQRIVIK